ncbi:MAG: hypothetical protein IK012_13180 [Fibrobacter sp.]|uniref:hypothetical protein n=1 Tax=Fibrobacter sp. TaxID=35828 RepID=UPI0025C02295|nr:hypothetical protein [Fibrobacter sp.]MBR4786185.1 hypothetical protein [Fibrobacter sp.]
MQKLIIATFVLRVLGLVLIVLGLSAFGHNLIYNTFPGLEGYSLNPVSYLGILIYIVGALIYFFVNKKRRADRRREEIEEAEDRAFRSSAKEETKDDQDA